jgi:hypothetical protein
MQINKKGNPGTKENGPNELLQEKVDTIQEEIKT